MCTRNVVAAVIDTQAGNAVTVMLVVPGRVAVGRVTSTAQTQLCTGWRDAGRHGLRPFVTFTGLVPRPVNSSGTGFRQTRFRQAQPAFGAGSGSAAVPTDATAASTLSVGPATNRYSVLRRWETSPTLSPEGLKMPIWAPM